MRNLLRYPITDEEIKEYLTKLKDEAMGQHIIGDIRPALIEEIRWRLFQDDHKGY